LIILYKKYLINSPKILIVIILVCLSLNAQTRRYEGKKKLKNKNPISNISAQKGLTIIGGYNMSTVKYNDDKKNDQFDITPRNGTYIGFEYRFPRLIVGAGFLERGFKFKQATTMNYANIDYKSEITAYEVYNYTAAHIFYPISINEQIEVFGGFQVGQSNGGTSVFKFSFTDYNSSKSDTLDMKPKRFGLDAGLQFGVDYMLNHRLGLRASYYMGMTNVIVIDTLINNENFKNNTLNLSAIIKLKGLIKKNRLKKPVSKINNKSRLLLPIRAFEIQIAGRIGSDTDSQSKVAIAYGLRDDITIGISNSNYLNTYDFFYRTNYFNKLVDKFEFPINLVYNSIISTQLEKPIIIDELDRLNFLHQLIIEYKIKSNIRLNLAPTYLHKNIADTKLEPKGYPWDIWFLETGVDWAFKDNIEIYGNIIQQMTDADISQGSSKSSIKFGLQYFIKTLAFDLSITNLYHLHGTAIIDDIGLNDYTEKFRIGFQINKMFNQ